MKIINKPGFEFVFTLSLMGILVLPLLVFSQNKKTISIKIINTDTTVNGVDIKKLSEGERKEALAAIQDIPTPPPVPETFAKSNATISIQADTKANKNVIIERRIRTNVEKPVNAAVKENDSTQVRVRLKKLNGSEGAFTYRFDNDLPPLENHINKLMPHGPDHSFNFRNRNSQNFNYSNTDNDGISTTISYSVNDADAEKLKKLTGAGKATLEVSDLNLSYEFSTGKTILTLTLPSPGAAELKLTNSNGKQLWADKISSAGFTKKFDLTLNGVYYLQIKQGNKVALKKIIKE
ncbi:T9SS type A sorting domain-containing protein [Mucilaginibacter litoreus]|uniref:T9SS type A sorting domain-containing protein n=1 Tax=Mucilaginibacter litoreus TaxID=1048221 RepID=A0ABW3AUN5_9SPHI